VPPLANHTFSCSASIAISFASRVFGVSGAEEVTPGRSENID
jgi:hypothetical protein